MAIPYDTTRVVFRHTSDDQGRDCGRACAQMIISSLTQGVLKGDTPTSGKEQQPVPVIQGALKALEADPNDVPGRWFTYPDELAALLNGNAQLQQLGLSSWSVANYATQDELLEHIGLTVKYGLPAVLNLRLSDHWVVVRSVEYDSGVVSYLQMLDPLYAPSSPPSAGHTYVDGCARDGSVWWPTLNLPVGSLATWSLPVGSYLPNAYEGRYVGIVHGPAPPSLAEQIAKRIKFKRLCKRPVAPWTWDGIRDELRRVAKHLELEPLARVVAADELQHVLRTVKDIDEREREYLIASVYSHECHQGVVAVLDPGERVLLHFRLTAAKALVDSFLGDETQPLWWTRRDLVTLFSPYFPFRRDVIDGEARFVRGVDDAPLQFAPGPAGDGVQTMTH